MRRRPFLVTLGVSIFTSGCIESDERNNEPNESSTPSYPDGCPTSQNYNVTLPKDISISETRRFVEEYEPKFISNNYIDTSSENKSVGTEPTSNILETNEQDDGIIIHVETLWSIITEMEDGEGIDDNIASARYYINKKVIRRTNDLNKNPVNGELLECI